MKVSINAHLLVNEQCGNSEYFIFSNLEAIIFCIFRIFKSGRFLHLMASKNQR